LHWQGISEPGKQRKPVNLMQSTRLNQWKHPSVVKFAGGRDPISVMFEKASDVTLNALQAGWGGPPFDPFALAELLHIPVIPNSEILDARTVPIGTGKLCIEYNPNRPRPRMRYSIAHEIAHSFFKDAAEQIRNRVTKSEMEADEWQLEMLCNLGAAEILMPVGSMTDMDSREFSIREVLDLRKQYEVSTESILLRLVRVTNEPYIMFVASRISGTSQPRYRIDYSIPSRSEDQRVPKNLILPKESILAACTAISYTAVNDEEWPGIGRVHVECVGLSPYPDSVFPRVAGLIRPASSKLAKLGKMRVVNGDATSPHAAGPKILAHVVNDATPNWGAGFGKAVQMKWPEVQYHFREAWTEKSRMRLGEVYFSSAEDDLEVCQMVCQHGYGASATPRLRYTSLKTCLTSLRDRAVAENATIHMPRIGTGEAGGAWALVSALIDEVLCAAGLSVTVYDLPDARKKVPLQHGLFDAKV
jgi:O-acetyl-ADP-ribose deacetylase (regulator of RNase III)